MIDEDLVRGALSVRLQNLGLSVPIAFENKDGPEASQRLEARLFRTSPQNFGIGGISMHTGFFQVLVVWDEDKGTRSPEQVAVAIAAHFPRNLKLPMADGHIVRISQTPAVGSGFPEGGLWKVPVSIYYEAWG